MPRQLAAARGSAFSLPESSNVAQEIQLLACGYSECERHAAWAKANRPNIYDVRSPSDVSPKLLNARLKGTANSARRVDETKYEV